jgi:toxin ParE1/3/4
MPHKIDWAEEALFDLHVITDYLAQRSVVAAERVAFSIVASVEALTDFPRIGRPGSRPDTRELLVADYPYLVVYRIQRNVISVVRIFHMAQDRDNA